MELIKGNKYLYSNTIKVGKTCKRTTKQLTVKYIGTEGNKEIFETESGTELLLHKNDVDKLLNKL